MPDLTLQALTTHSQAYQLPELTIGVKAQAGMILRNFTQDQLIKSTNWLKGENARGAAIYIRPGDRLQAHPWLFVDDLDLITIEEMVMAGHIPALVIETSPKNHQVWLKASHDLNAKDRSLANKRLAKLYGGDLASADGQHFGRLAGFTNRKPDYWTPQGFPFVKLLSYKSVFLSQEIIHDLIKPEPQSQLNTVPATALPQTGTFAQIWATEYRNAKARWPEPDSSIIDYRAAQTALAQGMNPNMVIRELLKTTPDLKSRGHSNPEAYVKRTVAKAASKLKAPESPRMP